MKITAETSGHAVILHLLGELTADSLEAFRGAVEHHTHDKEVIDLVLDMERVPFVDSAALEYLIDLQDTLAEKLGRVKLAKCDDNVIQILEITRMKSGFDVYEDIGEAAKAVQI